jgi:hypothetical protein
MLVEGRALGTAPLLGATPAAADPRRCERIARQGAGDNKPVRFALSAEQPSTTLRPGTSWSHPAQGRLSKYRPAVFATLAGNA